MKTRFILHGGMTSFERPHNDAFFTEISSSLNNGDTVLYVPFARESEEEQEEVYQRDKKAILDHTDKRLKVEMATLTEFSKQLQNAKAVYVTGGTSKILKERLMGCTDFVDLVRGKVYAGSSAGANVLSKYHTSYASDELQEGLGILPICVMAHYGNPDFNASQDRVSLFNGHIDTYELVLLPECEWQIKEFEI